MKKKKLIQLLQSCDETDLKRITDFLASPYYTRDENLSRLFALLSKYHPDFDAPELTKENLFRAFFPGIAYDDKQLRYLFSNLNKLLEKFLAVQRIEKHPHQWKPALLEELSERGLKKAYRQVERQLQRQSEERQEKREAFFFTQLRLAEIREQHFQRKRIRKFDPSLQHFANDLDKYYFLQRLKIACAMLDRHRIFQAEYRLNLSEAWIKHLESNDCFDEPLIRIYYTIFQALQQEEEEQHFAALTSYLDAPPAAIAREDLNSIYLFAINYCARKIRQGKNDYVPEALHLYRRGIETKVLLDEKGLSPWAFTNVVKLALRLRKYRWIESFIQEYAPQLPESFRENALHFNLAELYYYTRRFDEAQQHLNQVVYSDLNYYLGARVLLAKIFYESGEEEALLSLIASFTIFLKRNKQLSHDLKRTYLNFCQILFQIVRRSSKQMPGLQEKIDSSELLTDRAWLKRIYTEVRSGQ